MQAAERALLTVRSLSDVGLRRLANEDAYVNDDRFGMYVVCDGIGGQPSGEAASQTVVHALPHVLKRRLREAGHADDATLRRVIEESLIEVSAGLRAATKGIDILQGMGATAVGLLIDRSRAFLFHAGDSRAYRLRDGHLDRLTADHVRTYNRPTRRGPIKPGTTRPTQRRLLYEFMGMGSRLDPAVTGLHLEPGDRLLLCTDGVCDPVPDDRLAQLLAQHQDPADAVRAIVEAANAGGGPDNITATLIDYHAPRGGPLPDPPPTPEPPTKGVAVTLDHALRDLEDDLGWLHEGAVAIGHKPLDDAFEEVSSRLGPAAYHRFVQLDPAANPAHVFHQACTSIDGLWRRGYQLHLDAMTTPMRELDAARLSPVLTARETAAIFRSLWHDWRHVEARYYATSQRPANDSEERSLDVLVHHMLQSVRTLRGLLLFYPRFLRHPDLPPAPQPDPGLDDTDIAPALRA
ncbi:MAG: PP2C family serine/threonine-protein phosphatase [Planctomycetota bacterium]